MVENCAYFSKIITATVTIDICCASEYWNKYDDFVTVMLVINMDGHVVFNLFFNSNYSKKIGMHLWNS